MRLYRVVEVQDGVFRGQLWVPHPRIDRLLAFVRGRPIGPGRWMMCTSPLYGAFQAVHDQIADYEAERQKAEYALRTFPRELSWGHVANDGNYHQLRRD